MHTVATAPLPSNTAMEWHGAKLKPTLSLLAVSLFFWFMAPPEGLSLNAWHLLNIFLTTIVAVILKPLPTGAISLIATTTCVATGTLTLDEALTSFSSSVAWLIVLAFFLSLGFKVTGLGKRIAYFFISFLGRSTLGLSYGLVLTEFFLAPFVPSNTARGAGIIFPIVSSLAQEQGSCPTKGTEKQMGAFLLKVCFQVNMITSAMFLTGLVGNPLVVALAADNAGVEITWMTWALAAIVPGVANLVLLPLFLYKIFPPHVKESPDARERAQKQLKEMGSLSTNEIMMIISFFTILTLWIFGSAFGIAATTAALIGFSALLFLGVLKWKDCIQETAAWETLMWFAPLLMMATFLTKFGAMSWVADQLGSTLHGMSWPVMLVSLALIYFYIHYAFASVTARITALYGPFLMVLVAAGTPPMLAAISLAVLSPLAGTLTHFGTGTAPVYFGAGYMSVQEWWKNSFYVSLLNISIWTVIGGIWWKTLGYW